MYAPCSPLNTSPDAPWPSFLPSDSSDTSTRGRLGRAGTPAAAGLLPREHQDSRGRPPGGAAHPQHNMTISTPTHKHSLVTSLCCLLGGPPFACRCFQRQVASEAHSALCCQHSWAYNGLLVYPRTARTTQHSTAGGKAIQRLTKLGRPRLQVPYCQPEHLECWQLPHVIRQGLKRVVRGLQLHQGLEPAKPCSTKTVYAC